VARRGAGEPWSAGTGGDTVGGAPRIWGGMVVRAAGLWPWWAGCLPLRLGLGLGL